MKAVGAPELVWAGAGGVALSAPTPQAVFVLVRGRFGWRHVLRLCDGGLPPRRVLSFPVVVPTGLDVHEATGRIVITFGGPPGPLYGHCGGVLACRTTAAWPTGQASGQVLAHLFALTLAFLLLGLELSVGVLASPRAASVRRLIVRAGPQVADRVRRGVFGRCWAWPTGVRFLDRSDGTPVAIATATAIMVGRFGDPLMAFRERIGGMANCVHLDLRPAADGKPPDLIVSEGHLGVPDLLLQGRGLGAVWRWSAGGELQMLCGFMEALGASVEIGEGDANAICYIAYDSERRTVCWLQPMRDGASPEILQGLDEPNALCRGADEALLVLDKQGLKRVSLNRVVRAAIAPAARRSAAGRLA